MSTPKAEITGRVDKNLAAFLDMLAWSEGTDKPGQKTNDRGYDVLVGGQLFGSYVRHPNVLVPLPKLRISSTAAGRYQLLNRWYVPYRDLLKLKDFGPLSQDKIAIQQITERGALPDIKAGNVVSAISKCRNIWASLPGAGYGQHEQKLANLLSAYRVAGGTLK